MGEMSDEHKAALSGGPKNSAIVRRYLEAKEAQKHSEVSVGLRSRSTSSSLRPKINSVRRHR